MYRRRRLGAVNPAALVVFVGLAILCAILAVNAYKFFVPSALAVEKTEVVEALEVIGGLSPLRKNGVQVAQAESLRGGGSSRLVVTRTAPDGAFLLVRGPVSAGFLAGKIPLDKMLHLPVNATDISVQSDGQPVNAMLMLARTETNPLRADASLPEDVDLFDILYVSSTLQPAPAGTKTDGKFTSNNGMVVDAGAAMGRTGAVGLGDSLELTFTLDSLSSAWVEMPRTVRLQHSAVGAENLDLGILIPRSAPGTGPFKIIILGEEVASINRK
jgi:hypothetical protein